jgi:outer membrane protein assembly factor BamA
MFSARFVAVLVLLGSVGSRCHAQISTPPNNSAKAYPYTFANFIWWSDEDLRSQLKLKVPGLGDTLVPFSPTEKKLHEALVSLLKSKGIEAEVQSTEPSPPRTPTNSIAMGMRAERMTMPDAPQPAIVFAIQPPPEILVDSVTLVGEPPPLEYELSTITNSLQGKPYNTSGYWLTLHNLAEALHSSGYLSATQSFAAGHAKKDSPSKYRVPLTFTVVPGPQYRIASVTLDGGPLFQNRDLSGLVSFGPGAIAMPSITRRFNGTMANAYRQAGYAYVQVNDEPQLDVEKGLATYHLSVDPGPQYHVRKVSFSGLDPKLESQASDALGLKSGDPYNAMALMMLTSKLRNNPDFAGLNMGYQPTEDALDHVVDVVVTFSKR